MADLRISSTPPAVPAVQPSRADSARAAQRAFFDAALGQASGVEPTRRSVTFDPRPQGQAAAAPGAAVSDQSAPRTPRPGSLIDIKV